MTRDWPTPTRSDHQRFCEREGWRLIRDARGRTGTHHVTYELDLPDGRMLRTRVSHPPDRTSYGPNLFSHILRDQLDVTVEEFWTCVQEGEPPDRGAPDISEDALPAEMVHLLLTRVGLTERQVAGLSKSEAVARLNEYWTSGRTGGQD